MCKRRRRSVGEKLVDLRFDVSDGPTHAVTLEPDDLSELEPDAIAH